MKFSIYKGLEEIQTYLIKYESSKIYLFKDKKDKEIFESLWKINLILGIKPFTKSINESYLYTGLGENIVNLNEIKEDLKILLPLHRKIIKYLCEDFCKNCKKIILYYNYSIENEDKTNEIVSQIEKVCFALYLHLNCKMYNDVNFIEEKKLFNYSVSVNIPNNEPIENIKFIDIFEFVETFNSNLMYYYSVIHKIDKNNFN